MNGRPHTKRKHGCLMAAVPETRDDQRLRPARSNVPVWAEGEQS